MKKRLLTIIPFALLFISCATSNVDNTTIKTNDEEITETNNQENDNKEKEDSSEDTTSKENEEESKTVDETPKGNVTDAGEYTSDIIWGGAITN